MQIVAAVATAPGQPFEIESLDLDEPRADEILVRVVGVGLCHTDIAFRDKILPIGLPAVLGHEGSGVVERVGADVTKVAPGDRVVMTFRSCGVCDRCRADEPSYCEHGPSLNYAGVRRDGSKAIHRGDEAVSSNFFGQSSFATYALAYETNVVKIEDETVPLEILGPLGCGVQTGAGAILRSLKVPSGAVLLVTGGGSVGLSAVMGAVVAGCARIIVSDPQASRRELALSLGATDVIDPTAEDLPVAIKALTGAGCDYVLDTTGALPVMNECLQCLRPNGTLGLAGVPKRHDVPMPGFASQVLTYGYTIRGIIEGDSDPDVFIPELVALYKAGRFPFDRLIKTYAFEDINLAVQDQHDGLCTKPVLLMSPG